jgi:hypothetical protein
MSVQLHPRDASPEWGPVYGGKAVQSKRLVNHLQAHMDVWRQTIPNRPMSASNAPSLTVPPPVLLAWEKAQYLFVPHADAVIFKSVWHWPGSTGPQFG